MEEKLTLLIISKSDETLKNIEEILISQSNLRLILASSGEQALDRVRREVQSTKRVDLGFFDVARGSETEVKALIRGVLSVYPKIQGIIGIPDSGFLSGESYDFLNSWDILYQPYRSPEILQKLKRLTRYLDQETQLRAMAERLIRFERLASMGLIARGVGHEIGNILQRIIGKLDLALMESQIEPIFEHLKVAMTAAERVGVIVRHLRSFSKLKPNLQVESIHDALEEASSLVSHELVKASIQLTKNYGDVPSFPIDGGALAQVFLNLILNAAYSMPTGGRLTLTTELGEGPVHRQGVIVRVIDTGTGIAGDILSKIFEFEFTTKGDEGGGLGLAVSKEIIQAHGGEISVKTEVGMGTEFKVWLPLGLEH